MGVISINLIKREKIGSTTLIQASGQSSFISSSFWLSEEVYIEDLTQGVSRCCVNFQHIAAKAIQNICLWIAGNARNVCEGK